MTTIQLLLVAAIGVSLVVSFIMKMPSASRRQARKLLGSTDWLTDDSADGAMVKVTGVVRMREHGERFVSPLSENRCVVLRLRVLVRHGVDPRAKLVEKLEIMPFVLEDEDGKLLVDAQHALLDIPPVKQSRSAGPRKSQLLTDLGYDNANSGASDIEETLVEVGGRVTIAGTLAKQQGDTDLPLRIVGTAEHPIAIKLERAIDIGPAP